MPHLGSLPLGLVEMVLPRVDLEDGAQLTPQEVNEMDLSVRSDHLRVLLERAEAAGAQAATGASLGSRPGAVTKIAECLA
jgi:hypothetical protein